MRLLREGDGGDPVNNSTKQQDEKTDLEKDEINNAILTVNNKIIAFPIIKVN